MYIRICFNILHITYVWTTMCVKTRCIMVVRKINTPFNQSANKQDSKFRPASILRVSRAH